MKNTAKHFPLKISLVAALLGAALPGRGAIYSDLVCSYSPSAAAAWGGEANAQVNMANGVIGSNSLNDQTGTGCGFNIVGYVMSTADPVGQDTGYVEGLLASDPSFADVRSYGASVGADQIVYTSYQNTGAAGVAAQPGWASAISQTWWWLVVVAHETGGHNYGRWHNDGMVTPKTIMLHNYCGGGAAWPYFYTDPNIWWNGTQLLSSLNNNCSNGSLPNGGDNSSYSAQAVANWTDHVAVGPTLNHVIFHWCFTNTPAAASAGTTNYDLVSGAPAIVRGNGATYTGSALRIPGGTTGDTAMSSMSAYIDLPNGIVSSQTNLTIEIWATPLSAPNWGRILDFGRTTEGGDVDGTNGEWSGLPGTAAPGSTSQADGIMLSADVGTDITQQRFEAVHNGAGYTFNSSLATTAGVQHHYAITFTDGEGSFGTNGGRWEWYRDGYSVGFVDVSNHLSSIQDVNDWLGRSEWSGDSLANNDYAEVRISNVALSQPQLLANYNLGPNYHPSTNLVTMAGSDAWGATLTSFNSAGQWSGGAAPTSGKDYQTFDFRLLTPATSGNYSFAGNSLTVGSDASGDLEDGLYWAGTSSGAIAINNLTVNNARLDNRGSGTFTLAGNMTATNNVVVNAMNGPIALAANLSGNGAIAYVGNQGTQNGLMTTYSGNPVTLTGNNTAFTGRTVIGLGAGAAGGLTINSESRLGANPAVFTANQLAMNRGTLTTTATMSLTNSNRGILLDVNGGGFNVAAGTTLTIGCPLSSPTIAGGATGGNLNKTGAGTLILTSPNSGFNGMLYADSGGNNVNDGVVQIANNTVMASAHSPLYVRDTGASSSTLQLNGAAGGLYLPQAISMSGRSSTVPAIESLAGINTIAGGLSTSGSGSYAVQVDAGTLNIGGTSTSADGGADTISFQGNGAVNLNGVVTGALSVNKAGNGTLSFGPGSTYSGSTTVSQGTLALQGTSTPVLHLTFDNPAGSGNGSMITNTGSGGAAMNGTLLSSGGAAIVSGGRFGNALSLNGAGGATAANIVLISNKCVTTDATASWTVGFWLKTTTAGAVVLYQGDGAWSSSGQTMFYLNSNSTTSGPHAGAVRWGGGWLTGTATLTDNNWHFVALVDNAGTESIYVDGNVDAVTSTMANPLASDANQVWIGGSPDSGDGAVKMTGLIDEVSLYNHALSQAEVQSLYANNTITNALTNVLPATTPVTVAASGVLDLAGVSQTIGGLAGVGVVTNSGDPATLTVSNAGSATAFSGTIRDGSAADAISFNKQGSGTAILAGANNYHGSTTVGGGTLQLAPVANDAILHLTFDNAAGSGNGAVVTNTGLGGAAMNGTIVSSGGAGIVTGGRFGNALSLNGSGGNASNNIVVVKNVGVATDASGTWTVGYWIKTSTAGAVVMYQGDGAWASSGQTTFYLNNNGTTSGTHAGAVRWAGGWLTGTATLNDNNWHFVTLVDNAGSESIYVDGNVDAVTSTMANPLASDANQLWIGGSPDGGDGTAKMSGMIDELYLYNRALSPAEAQSLYSNNNFSTNNGSVLPATTSVSVASGAVLDLGGVSQTIASLAGNGVVTNTGGAATLTVSNSSGTATFGGSLGDASAAKALNFVQGGATTILSGANSYRGTTTIQGGTLMVNGSIGSGATTVAGGSLGGNGVINAPITVQASGMLAPGTGIGVLTVNNSVTLQAGSETLMEISAATLTNDQLKVSGTLTYGGTLIVTNLSGNLAAGESFRLFQAGTFTGTFASNSLPILAPGLAWSTANLNAGMINVVDTAATNLSYQAAGGSVNLSWPTGYTGWRLQVQTNGLNIGLSTNWTDVAGATMTNSIRFAPDPAAGDVYFRLIFP